MQGQREVPLTYASLIPIMLGVIVASGGEPAFNVIGFTCCLAATALRALKSVLQSMLMSDPAEKLDPMSLLLYMSGVSVTFLLPMAVALEPTSFREASALVAASPSFLYWLIGNSCLAYFVNLTNFLVTKFTSALTLQVRRREGGSQGGREGAREGARKGAGREGAREGGSQGGREPGRGGARSEGGGEREPGEGGGEVKGSEGGSEGGSEARERGEGARRGSEARDGEERRGMGGGTGGR